MTIKLNKKVFPVDSVRAAQILVEGVSMMVGSREFYGKNPIKGCPVKDDSGKVLGHISYNSRFWPVAS